MLSFNFLNDFWDSGDAGTLCSLEGSPGVSLVACKAAIDLAYPGSTGFDAASGAFEESAKSQWISDTAQGVTVTLPQLATHPDRAAYRVTTGTKTLQIPGGHHVPYWCSPTGRNITSFTIDSKVGK